MTAVLNIGVRGGTLYYANQIVQNFEKNVIHFTSSNNGLGDYSWKMYENNIQFILYTIFLLPFYLMNFAFLTFRYSINKLYVPYLHPWSLAFIITARVLRIEVVFTVHDGVERGKNSDNFMLNRYMLFCVKQSIKLSNKLIFLTEHVLNNTSGLIKKDTKTFIVPHGIISPAGLNSEIKKHSKPLNILFFGRVLDSKGVDLLIYALEKTTKEVASSLTIAGRVACDLPQINDERIKIINEYIDDSHVAELFNKSDVLILPYRSASQSGVLTIGIAARIPMIVSEIGGFVEQLNKQECLFVKKDSIDEIQNAITELAEKPDLYNSISKELDRKSEALSWDSIGKRIEKIISE